ncbi:MAG: DUF420 domain-containing protein [Pirellulales bacterium]|nr:DUF420 domain-containing protein [Pirellulales bacterium]
MANFEGVGFPGWDGFLGTRASLMLDVVFVAMIAVTSVMIWSIYQVRRRRKFLLHKRVQLVLAGALVIVVSAFEIDIRLYGWQDRAAGAPGGPVDPWVWRALYTHLFFAITTTLLWPWVIYRAWKLFPKPPRPGDHSSSHIFWARLAALDMLLTALTGWIFYGLAFVS